MSIRTIVPTAMAVVCMSVPGRVNAGETIRADSPESIRAALAKAGPGDTIAIKPGAYDMGREIKTGRDGDKAHPITLCADGDRGYARLKAGSQIAFRVKSKHWIFRGIHFEGVPPGTEATVFIDGPGGCGDILMTDCIISGSGMHGMKSSRTREQAVHNVVIEHTELYDSASTGFDLVSGDNWVLRRNYIHDFGKGGGVCYGIFLKGGGKNGLIEGNVVDGRKKATTIGISFGGGLTGQQWLPLGADGKVAAEHDGGVARNNIVMRTADVAYHSNNGANCAFYNNLAWDCGGFQRQAAFPKDPLLVNNLIPGSVRNADPQSACNLAPSRAWFVNPDADDFRLTPAGVAALKGKGKALPGNPVDFFGSKRDAASLLPGPVLPAATQSTKWISRR